VLFDFDGPICSVFAGYPAPVVARELREQLTRAGVDLPQTDDPLEVLRLAAPLGPQVLVEIEDMLIAAERAAALTAAPTRGGEESISACVASGRSAAIVSNNSAAAVVAYLAARGISSPGSDLVVGRQYAKPHLMKPHPAPVLAVLAAVGVEPGDAVLIGDTVTDVEAAAAAGVLCIGYANKPGKRERLRKAAVVIDDMGVLAEQLAAVPLRRTTR
jgi:phosphoglycolate phosphatase-like HAD superfamily hydrolase